MIIVKIDKDNPVIAWWSGGITSAIACWIAICWFGIDNVRIVFMDTKNEHEDTYRFLSDCEKWYGKKIEVLYNDRTIKQIWYDHLSLNVASGAICSYVLKRKAREEFQKNNKYSYQVFGFDIKEMKRAKSMALNNPDSRPLFPLITSFLEKKDCFSILPNDLFLSIEPPMMYKLGYENNNCYGTMCVQGGIGYWQKVKIDDAEKFNEMAIVEHELTDLKGEPVTMLKDQSEGGGLVFLKPHPKYPSIKDISMMKGRPPKPLMECNGFCGINDLSKKNETENEINF